MQPKPLDWFTLTLVPKIGIPLSNFTFTIQISIIKFQLLWCRTESWTFSSLLTSP